jgi:hypothetical protein
MEIDHDAHSHLLGTQSHDNGFFLTAMSTALSFDGFTKHEAELYLSLCLSTIASSPFGYRRHHRIYIL